MAANRFNNYDGDMNVHPLEVVFHKPIWVWREKVYPYVYHKEVLKYMKWARERANIFDTF
jgi:hypothetical protein